MDVSISSKVLPFVSGTSFALKKIVDTLIIANMKNTPVVVYALEEKLRNNSTQMQN